MTAEQLDALTWVGLALSYAVGVINIVLFIRARRRPGAPTDIDSLSGSSSSTHLKNSTHSDTGEGGAR